MDLRARLATGRADLVVELCLYSTECGGRRSPISLGWGCSCSIDRVNEEAWDGYPLLGDRPMSPGETRKVGFVFVVGQIAAEKMQAAGKFYLWEGGWIGEAQVLEADGA